MATISEKVFSKPLDSIQIEDLERFFEDWQDETITLEFKSGDASLETIYKEVSAFLNTSGGLIIYGSPKEEDAVINNQKIKRAKGALIPTTNIKTREQLIQKLTTNIVPPPSGIQVKQLIANDGSVYLIDVPQSVHPPHQVQETGTYYMRIDNIAKGAPHGFVSALFNQRQQSTLVAKIEYERHRRYGYLTKVKLNIMNDSPYPADRVHCIIDVYNAFDIMGKLDFRVSKVEEFFHKYTYSAGGGFNDVLLLRGLSMPITFTVEHRYQHILIGVIVYGSNCPLRAYYSWFNGDTHEEIAKGGTTEDPTHELIDRVLNEIQKNPSKKCNYPKAYDDWEDRNLPFVPKDEDLDEPPEDEPYFKEFGRF